MESYSVNSFRRAVILLGFSLIFSVFLTYSAVNGEMPRLQSAMVAMDLISLSWLAYRFWLGDRGTALRKDCIVASIFILISSSILSYLSVYVFHG